MSQSLSRRSFLKCAGSGAVSLAAALLTGVSAAAAQPRVMGQPALLDGKAAVELLGYAPAPGLGGVLVYLSVENLSARTLPVGRKLPPQPGCLDSEGALQSGQRRDRPLRGSERPLRQLCGTALRGERRRCLGLYAQPRRRARRDAPLLLRCPGGLGDAGAELSPCLCRRTAGGVRGAPGCRRRPPRTGAGGAGGSRKRCGFVIGKQLRGAGGAG
ncbi:MAG: hypothetical protein ACLVJH_04355 [Faecalibacterium prausnitzii]